LSLDVSIVEAVRRNGSLIIAGFAAKQGREVFAIPGSIHNLAAKGCHHLIRQGAKLVPSTEDVLEEIADQVELSAVTQSPADEPVPIELDKQYLSLLNCLGYEPISVVRSWNAAD